MFLSKATALFYVLLSIKVDRLSGHIEGLMPGHCAPRISAVTVRIPGLLVSPTHPDGRVGGRMIISRFTARRVAFVRAIEKNPDRARSSWIADYNTDVLNTAAESGGSPEEVTWGIRSPRQRRCRRFIQQAAMACIA